MPNEGLVPLSLHITVSSRTVFSNLMLYGFGQVADDGVEPSKETSLKRNMGSEFSCIIKEAKVIASTLGILCLDG